MKTTVTCRLFPLIALTVVLGCGDRVTIQKTLDEKAVAEKRDEEQRIAAEKAKAEKAKAEKGGLEAQRQDAKGALYRTRSLPRLGKWLVKGKDLEGAEWEATLVFTENRTPFSRINP